MENKAPNIQIEITKREEKEWKVVYALCGLMMGFAIGVVACKLFLIPNGY